MTSVPGARSGDALRVYRAAWVLPIVAPPRRNAFVATANGRIAGVASDAAGLEALRRSAIRRAETIDLGDRAILPGLVNAHTHLELSWMRGQVPPGESMPAWASRLVALRGTVRPDPAAPIHEAVREARAAGTAIVGDVTNTLAACDALGGAAPGGLLGVVFREVLGFAAPDPERLVADAARDLTAAMARTGLRGSVVPHAPYSVSPALFRAIAAAAGEAPLSVHLGENAEEMEFLREGTGAWRRILLQLGAWNDAWEPPRCGPVEYLDRLGLLTDRLLAIHGTWLSERELRRLAAVGATIVACPRSNRWTGAGVPPIAEFYESGVRVAIGTDSLASVEDLNLFAELAEVRRLAPGVPAGRLLASATWDGAKALGFERDLGGIEPGLRDALIAVRVPSSVEDVEEYLLSGIQPEDIEWLDS